MTKQELLNELNGFEEDVNAKISAFKSVIENMKNNDNNDNNDNDDILDEYIKGIGDGAHCLSQDGGINFMYNGCEFNKNNSHPYHCYPIPYYAKLAQKIKDFNDKLLAFKWCYDRNYTPDWKNGNEEKYYVYYDEGFNVYMFERSFSISRNVVYFSSREIAEKCCNWLNSELKGNVK